MQQIVIEKVDMKDQGRRVGVFAQGKWYSAWNDAWNQANLQWRQGQTLQAYVKQNGKYFNLYPSEPKPKGNANNSAALDKTNAILGEILAELRFANGKVGASGKQNRPVTNDQGYNGNTGCQTGQVADIPYNDAPPSDDGDFQW